MAIVDSSSRQRFPSFPIVIETYRSCLRDVFDVPALRELLVHISDRSIALDAVDTQSPSPFARSLVFAYTAAYLYESDGPDFTADAPNRVWVGDITYVWTMEGWMYLAVLIDVYSRRIVGWAMRPYLSRELAIEALRSAIELRRPPPGLIHHTDRGSQYASADYQRLLKRWDMRPSMSRHALRTRLPKPNRIRIQPRSSTRGVSRYGELVAFAVGGR